MIIITNYINAKMSPTSSVLTLQTQAWMETGKSAKVVTSQHAQRRLHPHVFMPPTAFSATWLKHSAFILLTGTSPTSYTRAARGVSSLIDARVWPVGILNQLEVRAVQDALLKLKGQKVNLSQAFFERKQTAGLVASSAMKIGKSLNALRKGRFADAAQALGLRSSHISKTSRRNFANMPKRQWLEKSPKSGMSQAWLELQYGWKPLLSDMYGAASQLRENDADQPDRYRYTVKSRKSEYQKSMFDTRVVTGAGINNKGTLIDEYGCFVRLDYRLDNPALAAAAATGMTNPLVLAWELVPWSFVADWFLPIGNYLNAMDADLGFTFMGGSQTRRWRRSYTDTVLYRDGYSQSPGVFPYYIGRGAVYEWKDVRRTIYPTSPVPSFPGFKNPFSLTHLANALSLLGSAVR